MERGQSKPLIGSIALPKPAEFAQAQTSLVFMASGTTVPTSWTTVYTVPARKQLKITWFSFYATDTDSTYVVKVRVTTAAGTSTTVGQGKPSAAGYVYQLVETDQTLIVPAGATVDIIGSGAGTVSINYYACGELVGLPG